MSTRLHRAVREGNTTELQSALEFGVDVNSRNDFNQTSLHLALELKHILCVAALLLAGADVELHDDQGNTPLHVAAAVGEPEQLAYLLLDYAEADPSSATDFNQVHSLLRRVSYVNVKNFKDETPLHLAARHDNVAAACVLIGHGAKVHARASGSSPLAVAAAHGSYRVCALLLQIGDRIDLESRDFSGRTPLLTAASEDAIEIAQLLLEEGADPNAQSNDGSTALVYAVKGANQLLAEMLINYGADIHRGSPPPLRLAFTQELEDIYMMLSAQSERPPTYSLV